MNILALKKGDMISHFFFSYVSHVVICKMKINNVPFCHTTGYAMKTSKIMILLTCTCINAQCLQSRKERPLHNLLYNYENKFDCTDYGTDIHYSIKIS